MSFTNEAHPPNEPYGSPARREYWAKYWEKWGGSNETHRELAGLIMDFENDITTHENMIDKYKAFKKMELPGNWDDAIRTATDTINHLKAAIAEMEAEFKQALSSIGKS